MKPRRSILTSRAIVAAGELLLPANPQRQSITFFSPSSEGFYTVSPVLPSQAGDGINLVHAGAHVRLTLEDDGDIVQKPWYAKASTTLRAAVLETLCDDA